MRYVIAALVSMCAHACALTSSSLARADSVVYVLRKGEAGLVVEAARVQEGKTRTWKHGEDGFIDIIMPPGPGGSGTIVQSAMKYRVEANSKGGVLTLKAFDAAGKSYERPVMAPEELAALDIRVSAKAQDGSTYGGFIRGYERVERDDIGPIEDMFGGKVPLHAGDCTIHTNTFAARRRRDGAGLTGNAPLREVRGHHLAGARAMHGGAQGADGEMVIDLAAGATVVLQGALPPGVEVRPSEMVEHSPAGVRRLASEVGGATGSVKPLGIAHVDSITLGGVEIADVDVLVMKELPMIGDHKITGIIGIDLIARASSVSFERVEGEKLVMRLGTVTQEKPDAQSPLSIIGDRAYARVTINSTSVCTVIDTGSPFTILDGPALAAAGLERAEEAEQVRGLAEKRSGLDLTTPCRVELGGIVLENQRLRTGSIPIFKTMRAGGAVGILGNDVLSKFARVQIDFEKSRLNLWR